MSADAKIWQGDNGLWCALHDGPHTNPHMNDSEHAEGSYYLAEKIIEVEECYGKSFRWDFRLYPDGKLGLCGYTA